MLVLRDLPSIALQKHVEPLLRGANVEANAIRPDLAAPIR